jgi:hypothetical protein
MKLGPQPAEQPLVLLEKAVAPSRRREALAGRGSPVYGQPEPIVSPPCEDNARCASAPNPGKRAACGRR